MVDVAVERGPPHGQREAPGGVRNGLQIGKQIHWLHRISTTLLCRMYATTAHYKEQGMNTQVTASLIQFGRPGQLRGAGPSQW